ncbi:MAG TPA: PQQ-binding-like beta-propeller repeat protein [Gemmataceae bacterium]|jgi:outer membrane protein assembly factor BamB|nr:PQQ-binding-like beta-propeller repeat protein [Gemmataceae bacterium]
MRKLFGLGFLLLAMVATAPAQDTRRLYSRPAVPARADLDRLNLKVAWHTYVATDGQRDGLFSVQMLGDQVLVQNRSGIVTLLDAGDGSTVWRAQPGHPYNVYHPLAYNSRSVFAVRGAILYCLDRKTGKQQWEFSLPHGVSATPFADDERFFLCLLTRELYCYELPEISAAKEKALRASAEQETGKAAPDAAKKRDKGAADSSDRKTDSDYNTPSPAEAKSKEPTEPKHLWTYGAETRLERVPLGTQDFLAVSGVDGIYFATSKFTGKPQYRLRAEAAVTAPLGQYGGTAYLASQDFNVYAVDIEGGRILWRFTARGPILQKPQVNDQDVYVAPYRSGLDRVQRTTGHQVWHNKDANRFLAANKKFVYAADQTGRLLVLDRIRGTQLSSYDARDFVVPISNEVTDRVFLASNDGLLLCLRDRDYPNPQLMKRPSTAKPEGGTAADKSAPKDGADKARAR